VHYFYGNFDEREWVELTGDEARHALVLRLKIGEQVGLQNGVGRIRIGETVAADNKKIVFKILNTMDYPVASPQIHLAVSLIKDKDRMEWLIEKITEIGVSEFTPLLCEHTDKSTFNKDRWDRIISSAFKQCGRAWRPLLRELSSFDSFMRQSFDGHKYIAIQSGNPITGMRNSFSSSHVVICIGPEGDFSTQELSLANQQGFEAISFGPARFRTETAGLIAAIWMSLLDLP